MEVMSSEVVVANVRVLAMGQTVEKKGSDPVVIGSTATLELTPRQAEHVLLAQKSGSLALTLRPIIDTFQKAEAEDETSEEDNSILVIKHGLSLSNQPK